VVAAHAIKAVKSGEAAIGSYPTERRPALRKVAHTSAAQALATLVFGRVCIEGEQIGQHACVNYR